MGEVVKGKKNLFVFYLLTWSVMEDFLYEFSWFCTRLLVGLH